MSYSCRRCSAGRAFSFQLLLGQGGRHLRVCIKNRIRGRCHAANFEGLDLPVICDHASIIAATGNLTGRYAKDTADLVRTHAQCCAFHSWKIKLSMRVPEGNLRSSLTISKNTDISLCFTRFLGSTTRVGGTKPRFALVCRFVLDAHGCRR